MHFELNIRRVASVAAVGCALVISTSAARAQFAMAPARPDTAVFRFSPAALAGGSFLGVGVAEVTPERARDLKLREEYGVEITRVEEDSPAAKAGLNSGDVILEYNGQRVEGIEQFGRLVRETPAGRAVKLAISRGGAMQTVRATVESRKNHPLLNGDGGFAFEMPEIHIPELTRVFPIRDGSMMGVEAESLGKQLSVYFGVKEGLLVRSVVKGSPADAAGMKAGDVITKVDQTPVSTVSDLSNAMRVARSKKTFPVHIVRERRETTVTVTVDDDRSGRQVIPRTRVVRGGTARM